MKKTLVILLALVMVFAMFGCTAKAPTTEPTNTNENNGDAQETITLKIGSLDVVSETDYSKDRLLQEVESKFNVKFEFVPLSWGDWTEKNRVWISTEDMPDLTMWDFNNGDYQNYAKQGLIKEIPADLSKYPDLKDTIDASQFADVLKERHDGKLYCLPRTIHKEAPVDVLNLRTGIMYRKDWAEELGMTDLGDVMTFSQLEELMTKYKEKNSELLGMVTSSVEMMNFFMTQYQPSANYYHKVDGKYAYTATLPETLDGLKMMKSFYDKALIHPDFYTFKTNQEVRPYFHNGQTGVIVEMMSFNDTSTFFADFEKANPGKKAEDCIGFALVSQDGKEVAARARANFWTASLINPEISDEKLDRLLSVLDYTCSDEGQDRIFLGVKDEDYKVAEDGTITITRPTDENGNFVLRQSQEPSFAAFQMLQILPDNFSVRDPSFNKAAVDQVLKFFDLRSKGNVLPIDYDVMLFSAPNFNKTYIDQNTLVSLVVDGGDVADLESKFNAWAEDVKVQVQPALDELNEAYGE